EIDALRHIREDKFDEMCSTIAFAYGAVPDPKKISDVRKVDQIIKAAEKSIKRRTVRGNWDLETKTKLQRLPERDGAVQPPRSCPWKRQAGDNGGGVRPEARTT